MRSGSSWAVRVLSLLLATILVPACGNSTKNAAPNILNNIPASMSTVSRSPLIVFQFDHAMDPTFMTAIYFGFVDSGTGTPVGFGVENIPLLNEVRIYPTALLTVGHSYDVFASGSVQSVEGTPMGANEGITITVENTSNVSSAISFATPVASTGTSSGDITLTWSAATESQVSPPGTVNVTNYDVYVVLVSDGEDYLNAPFTTTASTTGITLSGLAPNTPYFIKVVPRDSEGNIPVVAITEQTATSHS